ncbi:MAG: universal stress protein [Polyangiaceae bacterium]
MSEDARINERRRLVLVVGVDLSDVSEHVLAQTRTLIRPFDLVEVHVVHVINREPLASAGAEYAISELRRLCDHFGQGARPGRADVFVHTPAGDPAAELLEVASRVNADMIVVEAHDPSRHRFWHRSILPRLVRSAPCTVLTIRGHATGARAVAAPAVGSPQTAPTPA